jgi:hypothetical protein
MSLRRHLAIALATSLLGFSVHPPLAAAPRFGGGDIRAGDARRGGYTFDRGGSDAYRSGYTGYHPMYGGNTRSSYGSSPTVDPSATRINNNSFNRTDGNFDNDRFNRNVNVDNNFYNRDYNGFNRNWSNGGYWNNRPWNTGWYRGGTGWGWWGASAAAWGVAGLATGAVIGGLVNAAANDQSPVFVVPNTGYQLNYGSVEGVGSYGVSFNYLVNGTQLMGAANCQQGLLNGQVPNSASQAQLLNAVCQVAYGSGN